jgi:hypothetical protein
VSDGKVIKKEDIENLFNSSELHIILYLTEYGIDA